VIVVAVRWYLRYNLSYRDVEELLIERGIEVDRHRASAIAEVVSIGVAMIVAGAGTAFIGVLWWSVERRRVASILREPRVRRVPLRRVRSPAYARADLMVRTDYPMATTAG
jgi:hypothetical protein